MLKSDFFFSLFYKLSLKKIWLLNQTCIACFPAPACFYIFCVLTTFSCKFIISRSRFINVNSWLTTSWQRLSKNRELTWHAKSLKTYFLQKKSENTKLQKKTRVILSNFWKNKSHESCRMMMLPRQREKGKCVPWAFF